MVSIIKNQLLKHLSRYVDCWIIVSKIRELFICSVSRFYLLSGSSIKYSKFKNIKFTYNIVNTRCIIGTKNFFIKLNDKRI